MLFTVQENYKIRKPQMWTSKFCPDKFYGVDNVQKKFMLSLKASCD